MTIYVLRLNNGKKNITLVRYEPEGFNKKIQMLDF